MKDQHKLIKGYRDLTQSEIDSMNQVKELAEEVNELVTKLQLTPGLDQRSIEIGKTNLQQGFMWVIRGIAQPDSF